MTIIDLVNDIRSDKNSRYSRSLTLDVAPKCLSSKIKDLCKNLGIKLLNLCPTKSVLWDGYFLRYRNLYIDCILHEIAHFQIAKSYHRYQIDFALGKGPESLIVLDEKKIVKSSSVQEEYASVLGILWCLSFEIMTSTVFIEHSWNDSHEDIYFFKKFVVWLQNQGFLDSKFQPLPRLND